ncbi:MAG: cytochrome c5 family protein [Mycobacterium sp.]|nr:cytochrome c5 family protein [Burkholderiaceae bacterium]MBV8294698.1 cytochrome c5 family protein [Mycobacterium sp.]
MGTATRIAGPCAQGRKHLKWFCAVMLGAAPVWALAAAQTSGPAMQSPAAANAQQGSDAGQSGQQVVEAVCARCHRTGLNGAPKIGDQAAWSKRAAQGLTSLTQHALDGIRRMPAHGGSPNLTDLEISRAITYMVNRSGGHWFEPVSTTAAAAERSGEQVVKTQCVKCHEPGLNGAPKIGDRKAWLPRMKQGVNYLVRSAMHGHGGMPPRGGEADLTDSELKNAILYMFDPTYTSGSQAAGKGAKQSAATASEQGSNHVISGNMDVFLGIVSAKSLLTYPSGSVERSMHGGVPEGPDYYHVNVSLQDHGNQAMITDARVAVRIEQAGAGVTDRGSKALELMPIPQLASFGNYVQFKRNTPYQITVQIRTPSTVQPVEARFEQTFY